MATGSALDQIEVSGRAGLRSWLEANHQQAESVWLVCWKAAHPDRHIPYGEIVDEVLCFGWIDSLPRKFDADRSLLLLSPRKPGSAWSAVNKAKAARLIEQGLMAPASMARIEAAKANGAWTFLDDVDRLEVPADLKAAFGRHPGSGGHFERFPPSARRGILEWIKQARTPATRDKRVEETARLAAENIRANQFRR